MVLLIEFLSWLGLSYRWVLVEAFLKCRELCTWATPTRWLFRRGEKSRSEGQVLRYRYSGRSENILRRTPGRQMRRRIPHHRSSQGIPQGLAALRTYREGAQHLRLNCGILVARIGLHFWTEFNPKDLPLFEISENKLAIMKAHEGFGIWQHTPITCEIMYNYVRVRDQARVVKRSLRISSRNWSNLAPRAPSS